MPKQQRKSRKTAKFVISNKEGNKFCVSLPQLGNNPDHWHEVKLLIQILHLSAKAQVFRKSPHSSLSRYIFTILMPLYHEINS